MVPFLNYIEVYNVVADFFVDLVYIWVSGENGAKDVWFVDESFGDVGEIGYRIRDVILENMVFYGGVLFSFAQSPTLRSTGLPSVLGTLAGRLASAVERVGRWRIAERPMHVWPSA